VSSAHPTVLRPLEARFLAIPQAPLSYWLRERLFGLLAGPTLRDVADVSQGLPIADGARFDGFTWEARPDAWARPTRNRRWVPFEKGAVTPARRRRPSHPGRPARSLRARPESGGG
jgi:hypothetical protein